ncbi:MAG: GNAT family N-acetyltransferase, partial [bacterium]
VGQALLDDTFEFFRKRNRKEIVIAPYTPNYFVPGIDKENYAEGVRLFQKNGFAEYSEGIAMDASIPLFRLTPEVIEKERALAAEEIIFRPLGREDILPYQQFLKECMPGPWVEDARRNLLDATKGIFDYDACLLALDGGKIIGYCAFEREHYGPYGVSDKYQGKGIGTVLMARTLDLMRQKGYHSAWVLWTGERAAKGVYGRLGFKITRRFAIMKKTL